MVSSSLLAFLKRIFYKLLFVSPKNNLQLRGKKSPMKAESSPFVSAKSPRSLGFEVSVATS